MYETIETHAKAFSTYIIFRYMWCDYDIGRYFVNTYWKILCSIKLKKIQMNLWPRSTIDL